MYVDSFVRLTENLKLYNHMKLKITFIHNHIKILQRQCSRKTAVKELGKME